MPSGMIQWEGLPTAVFERDAGSAARGLESDFDLGHLARGEVCPTPFKDQTRIRLPRDHAPDGAHFSILMHLDEPSLSLELEAENACTPRAAKTRPAPPPSIDLLGEDLERIARIHRDEGRYACTPRTTRRGQGRRLPLPLAFSACRRNASSWSVHTASTRSSQSRNAANGSCSNRYSRTRASVPAASSSTSPVMRSTRKVTAHRRRAHLECVAAGILDELQIHQIPVLFGGGRRLFEVLPSRVELEIARVIDTPEATHIRYRVRR